MDQFGNFPVETRDLAVESAISIVLQTPIGTRPMYKDFGSNLHRLRFLNADESVVSVAANAYVQEAFTNWLPELQLESVKVTVKTEAIVVDIGYIDTEEDNPTLQQASVIFERF